MFPFFGVVVDRNTDPKKIVKSKVRTNGGA